MGIKSNLGRKIKKKVRGERIVEDRQKKNACKTITMKLTILKILILKGPKEVKAALELPLPDYAIHPILFNSVVPGSIKHILSSISFSGLSNTPHHFLTLVLTHHIHFFN